MTTQEKNIAIAEMLGWRKGHRDFPKEKRWKDDWFDRDELRRTRGDLEPLLFHSDANWQFEAIEFVEKINANSNGEYYPHTVSIWKDCCVISDGNNGDDIVRYYSGSTKKEAIFEALYQFSQYLKQKK